MDVKLQNAYVEVVLENFMSVIKQNLMFQTQLQLANDTVNENNTLKTQIQDLSQRNIELQSFVDSLSKNNSELKTVADKKIEDINYIDSLKKDKSRIQTALNDSMREVKKLKEELENRNKYMETLEKSVSSNSLKKLKSPEITKDEVVKENVSDISSGGTF
jgi:predicted RNase H-like nuclease (RuvC/YqgF family)